MIRKPPKQRSPFDDDPGAARTVVGMLLFITVMTLIFWSTGQMVSREPLTADQKARGMTNGSRSH